MLHYTWKLNTVLWQVNRVRRTKQRHASLPHVNFFWKWASHENSRCSRRSSNSVGREWILSHVYENFQWQEKESPALQTLHSKTQWRVFANRRRWTSRKAPRWIQIVLHRPPLLLFIHERRLPHTNCCFVENEYENRGEQSPRVFFCAKFILAEEIQTGNFQLENPILKTVLYALPTGRFCSPFT